MKITKTIREYIEQTVRESFAKRVNPHKEQAERDRLIIEEFFSLKFKRDVQEVAEFIERCGISSDTNLTPEENASSRVYTIRSYGLHTPAIKLSAQWDVENGRECEKKIKDIILQLELGASRDEFNEIMSEFLAE